MDITEMEYRNNLLFYTILKDLLKCKLGEKKTNDFRRNY